MKTLPVRAPALRIRGATVVTCDESNRVRRADVVVRNGTIAGIGGRKGSRGERVLDARGRIVMPGLVQAHVHLCQALMRGLADDLPLLSWLERRVWPLEAAHDARSLRVSAEVGLAEMILAGTTAILDLGTVHGYDVVLDACVRSGMRVVGGKTLMDRGARVPPRLRERTSDALRDAERLEGAWAEHPSGRVGVAWIPRFILSCSRRLIEGAALRAGASGALLHTHASEHPGERAAVRKMLGADDIDVLRRWGVRGPRASIAHGVQLTRSQMKRMAKDGMAVAHCPSANLKLGSGIARVAEMRETGLTVGIGADGAPCNNNLDPWIEMRRAALLSSYRAGPGRLAAADVLRMATMGGARLLGQGDRIGSIEVGKRADLVVVRTDGPHVAPFADPVEALVYAVQSRDVEHVIIDGRHVVDRGELVTLDADRIVAEAPREARRLARRAGI